MTSNIVALRKDKTFIYTKCFITWPAYDEKAIIFLITDINKYILVTDSEDKI